jgi:uncharacterized protein YbjT (DUF2867 family)
VARHHGVEAFVNMSQMTVTQMSISETTDSPQHKLHWLAEQALSWSGLPVVTVRPTVFLEGFFRQLAAPGVRSSDELSLPMSGGRLAISAIDIGACGSGDPDDPAPHIGQIYDLTGPESMIPDHFARAFEALGRPIRSATSTRGVGKAFVWRSILSTWWASLGHGRVDQAGALRPHDGHHAQAPGQAPTNMREFVKLHAASSSSVDGSFVRRSTSERI